jgi:hypothetical protein
MSCDALSHVLIARFCSGDVDDGPLLFFTAGLCQLLSVAAFAATSAAQDQDKPSH